MKKSLSIILLSLLFVACGGNHRYTALMQQADSLLTADKATAAYRLLTAADTQKTAWNRSQRMAYELLKAEAQNKAYIDFKTDSILRIVAQYYDDDGTPNQRLRAHYLLGCAYRDLHEAPLELECFQKAVSCVDTTAVNCDFNTLSCVYSQMAELYHQQLLFSNEIECHRLSCQFAFLASDTLNAIYEYGQNAAAYILLNKSDSAEQILLHAKELYLQHDYVKEWAWASTPLLYLYLRKSGRLAEVKTLLDFYERASGVFDENGDIPLSKRMFYRYKGQYYEKKGRLDSAEYFYRKMYHPQMQYTQKDAMYHGLLDVFIQQNSVDSIVKYALLFCQANDSSVVRKDQELIARTAASYNYSRMQRQATELKIKTANARSWMTFFIALSLFLVLFGLGWWRRGRIHRLQKQMELNRLRNEFTETERRYQAEKQAIRLLEANQQNMMELAQLKLKSSEKETELYRSRLKESQQKLNQLSAIHEDSIHRHQSELNSLRMKIAELEHFTTIQEDLEKVRMFKTSDIARQILQAVEKSQFNLQEEEWNCLKSQFSQCYPTLLFDLHKSFPSHEDVIRVCILLILGLRESDIANILQVGNSAVSNIKSAINLALFNEKSSRSLIRNLEKRYGLFA